MNNFTRVLSPGFILPGWHRVKRGVRVFVKIEYIDGRLSITGVEGPMRSGNAVGSCGQIDLTAIDSLEKGWTREMFDKLITVWKRWHLNDMRPSADGSTWLHEDVPDDVLEWLKSLPETTMEPAWVCHDARTSRRKGEGRAATIR